MSFNGMKFSFIKHSSSCCNVELRWFSTTWVTGGYDMSCYGWSPIWIETCHYGRPSGLNPWPTALQHIHEWSSCWDDDPSRIGWHEEDNRVDQHEWTEIECSQDTVGSAVQTSMERSGKDTSQYQWAEPLQVWDSEISWCDNRHEFNLEMPH